MSTVAEWKSQRIRVAYCACVFTFDMDVSLLADQREASIRNMVFETRCARHAALADAAASHAAIRAESITANGVMAAALTSGVQGVVTLPLAGLISVDGSGIVVLGPTGLTALLKTSLQTIFDAAVGAGKSRVV